MANQMVPTATAGQLWVRPSFVRETAETTFGEDGQFEGRSKLSIVDATPATMGEAQRWLEKHRDETSRVQLHKLGEWLVMLAMQTNTHNESIDTVKARAAAYGNTLGDHPAYWFTPETGKAAARKFTWFPSVAELTGFLAKECAGQDALVRMCKQMATANVGQKGTEPSRKNPDAAQRLRDVLESYKRHGRHDDAARIQREIDARG